VHPLEQADDQRYDADGDKRGQETAAQWQHDPHGGAGDPLLTLSTPRGTQSEGTT